jgi:hypothetical protein
MLAAMFSGRHTLPRHPTTVPTIPARCSVCLLRCQPL